LACLVTPNIPEAERLAGFAITSEADMKRAAEAIRSLGSGAVLVKGGHRRDATDILLDETGSFTELREAYVEVGEVHGTGCTLSAAIAASLASGLTLKDAVGAAKKYLTDQIRALTQSSPFPS